MVPFTKPIWSGPNPYRTTVRTKFGYVNGTFRYQKFGPGLAGPAHVQGQRSDKIWSGVTVYLAPLTSLPPPGGQAVPGYLTPVADNSKHHPTKFSLYGRGAR